MDPRSEEWGYDPQFTHMPILSVMLNKTIGDVIEFGCGFYSTPLIAYNCEVMNRKSESYERDLSWFHKIDERFKNAPKLKHSMIYIDDYEKIDLENRKFGLVFIDQELETRTLIGKKISDKADFIIIHDSEAELAFKYNELYPLFKWQYQFKFFHNWTCVLSNKEDPKKLLGLDSFDKNNPLVIKQPEKKNPTMVKVVGGSTINITLSKIIAIEVSFYWREDDADCICKYWTEPFKTKEINIPKHAKYMNLVPSTEIERIENVQGS